MEADNKVHLQVKTMNQAESRKKKTKQKQNKRVLTS